MKWPFVVATLPALAVAAYGRSAPTFVRDRYMHLFSWRNVGLFCSALVLIVLAACSPGAGGATTPTAHTSPTPSPTSVSATPPPSCSEQMQAWFRDSGESFGDILVSPAIAQPESILYQLPDGTPLRPLSLPPRPADGSTGDSYNGRPAGWPVSTLGATAIHIGVCNTSGTVHSLQSVQAKITAFAPYTSQLNVWEQCSGGYYTRAKGPVQWECSLGGVPDTLVMHATFGAQAKAGATASATPVSATVGASAPSATLPIALPPGQMVYLAVKLTPPTAPGTYTFAAGLTTDAGALPFTTGTPLLLAPIERRWSGQACTASSMQGQLPAGSGATTLYICPKA